MNNTISFRVKSQPEIKAEAQAIFEEIGLDVSTAINLFFRQTIRTGGIPFDLKADIPNAETRAALIEGDMLAADPNVKTYSSVDELLKEDLS